ncbi:MAG TPA: acyl-CoA dehydrogenase family protein [Burkholderiaceae bacterium]|nr:acyl-CoA dehydrogenase family protein [Burkholderiaceae bacterium]
MKQAGPDFESLLSAVKGIATDVAARHAADVDAQARFPHETVDALKRSQLMSAPVPKILGGSGCTMRELALLCSALAQACGSSAMVLAMHYIQVACIARHAGDSRFFAGYLRELVEQQYVLASMTSEVGTFGDTRSSICAVEVSGDRFVLNKDATTGSYCAQADAILVTCRRAADAPKSDQVLVLVRKADYTLKQTTSWDTMGMRGTCSPGFRLESQGHVDQIVPGSFADSSAQTMVPYSHILWSSLWWGIAADAVGRAATYVRGDARKNPGVVPPTATRLAEVSVQLQAMRHNWLALAQEFDEVTARPDGMQDLLSIGWALKMNHLKTAASEAAPQIVHRALQIVGILGYKNDSPFSLGRHYRDTLSAALMISNERIAAKSASMLLVFKDD